MQENQTGREKWVQLAADQLTYLTSRGLVNGVFPAGPRYFSLMGNIDFEFPRPGSYRLDITVDEEFAGNVFSYNIDLWMRKGT